MATSTLRRPTPDHTYSHSSDGHNPTPSTSRFNTPNITHGLGLEHPQPTHTRSSSLTGGTFGGGFQAGSSTWGGLGRNADRDKDRGDKGAKPLLDWFAKKIAGHKNKAGTVSKRFGTSSAPNAVGGSSSGAGGSGTRREHGGGQGTLRAAMGSGKKNRGGGASPNISTLTPGGGRSTTPGSHTSGAGVVRSTSRQSSSRSHRHHHHHHHHHPTHQGHYQSRRGDATPSSFGPVGMGGSSAIQMVRLSARPGSVRSKATSHHSGRGHRAFSPNLGPGGLHGMYASMGHNKHQGRAPTFMTRSSASPVSSPSSILSRSPSEHSLASSFLDPDDADGRSYLPSVRHPDGDVDPDADEDASLRPILPSHSSSPAPSTYMFNPILSPSGGIPTSRSTEPIRFSASLSHHGQSNPMMAPPPSSLHGSTSYNRLSLNSRPPSIQSTTGSISSARYASSDAQSKGWKSVISGGADSFGGQSTKPTTVASAVGVLGQGGVVGNPNGEVGHIAQVDEEEDDVADGLHGVDGDGNGTMQVHEGGNLNGAGQGNGHGHHHHQQHVGFQENALAGPSSGPGYAHALAQGSAQGHGSGQGQGTGVIPSAVYRTMTRASAGSVGAAGHPAPSPLSTSVVPAASASDEALNETAVNEEESPGTPPSNGQRSGANSLLPGSSSATGGQQPPPSPLRYRLIQAPPRTDPHPRHNPRPLSPPSDNASVLTLASSAYAYEGHPLWTRSIAGTLDERSLRIIGGGAAWGVDEETDSRTSGISLDPPIVLDEMAVPLTAVPPRADFEQGPGIKASGSGGVGFAVDDADNASVNYQRGYGGPPSLLGGLTASSYYFGGRRRSVAGEDASIRALRRRGSWESEASRFSWVPGASPAPMVISPTAQSNTNMPLGAGAGVLSSSAMSTPMMASDLQGGGGGPRTPGSMSIMGRRESVVEETSAEGRVSSDGEAPAEREEMSEAGKGAEGVNAEHLSPSEVFASMEPPSQDEVVIEVPVVVAESPARPVELRSEVV